MLKIQGSLLCVEENSTKIAKLLWKTSLLENTELFQTTRIPLEAPIEGRKQNSSKELGQNFLI